MFFIFFFPSQGNCDGYLRKRSHGLTLTATESSFVRKNFINKMLYKDIYLHCFACMIVVYNVFIAIVLGLYLSILSTTAYCQCCFQETT